MVKLGEDQELASYMMSGTNGEITIIFLPFRLDSHNIF